MEKEYRDPVIDPRESWTEWGKRQLEFKDPPLIERDELAEELQPQNRKMGKLRHYLSNFAMSPMVHKKPKYNPQDGKPSAALS